MQQGLTIFFLSYATLIVFANYLIELKGVVGKSLSFPEWLRERREISNNLSRASLV